MAHNTTPKQILHPVTPHQYKYYFKVLYMNGLGWHVLPRYPPLIPPPPPPPPPLYPPPGGPRGGPVNIKQNSTDFQQ